MNVDIGELCGFNQKNRVAGNQYPFGSAPGRQSQMLSAPMG